MFEVMAVCSYGQIFNGRRRNVRVGLGCSSAERSDVLPQATMNLLQDSTHTMRGLNARLRGFLEQVGKLQEDNQRLEAQIVNWGSSRSHDWSRQEEAVSKLRAQVRQSSACFSIRLELGFATVTFHFRTPACVCVCLLTHTHSGRLMSHDCLKSP